ncbi:MAG: hypothetical protein QME48_05275 [bacterium]|nr:hypothetical protein [bacterium]
MVKRFSFFSIVFLLLFSLSCSLLPWVKDPNNIYDWSSNFKEDVTYYYKSTNYISAINYTTTYNYQWKVVDVTEKTDKKVYTINDDGQTRFLVVDKDENLIFYGKDEYFSGFSEDEVLLEAPVTIDNSWIYKSETRKVSVIDTTVEITAGKYNDVVKVKIVEDDYYGYLYWSVSKGLIYKYIEYTNGNYTKVELIDVNE